MEKDRLNQVIDRSGLSQKDFAEKFYITHEALKNYLYGRRKIPVEFLIKVVKEYKVTLDWFYGISEGLNKEDSMVKIVSALSKVFTISIKKTPFCENDQVLLMDKRFKNLLADIQNFCYYKENSIQVDEEVYNKQRMKIYERHEKYLKELLGEVIFVEEDAFEIYGVYSSNYNNENDSLLNYLSSAIEK